MTLAKKEKRARKSYAEIAAKNVEISPVTDRQYEIIEQRFYSFAKEYGFYKSLSEAKKRKGRLIYPFQREIASAILRSCFKQETIRLNISIMRQVGKTEFVSLAVGFCYRNFFKVFGRPINICVVAPDQKTSTKVFQTITKYIDDASITDKKSEKRSKRGDQIDLFGIFDEFKGGTIEGRTYDIVIRDEAHRGNDRKFNDEVRPTTISNNNIIVFIGNGGFKRCDFMDKIERGSHTEKVKVTEKISKKIDHILLRYSYKEIKPYLQKLAESGIESATTRIANVESEIREHGGEESWEVLKNYYCKWITEFGNYVTDQQLALCRDSSIRWYRSNPEPLYVGIDFAKAKDRTVATFVNQRREIVDWFVMKESNEELRIRYQCELLRDYCDSKRYTPHIQCIAADSTGLGIGAMEFLEQEFGFSELLPYSFTDKKKHEWYSKAREQITTRYEQDRIKYNPKHKHAEQFEKELLELEVEAQESKKQYLQFHAPNRQNCFDDFVASFVIAIDARSKQAGMFDELKTFREREGVDIFRDPGPKEPTPSFFARYTSSINH